MAAPAAFENNQDLPADNAARLAIYDALSLDPGHIGGISSEDLFDQVIGRLRVLVPRELHLHGEPYYVDEKIHACIRAGIIASSSSNGRWLLALTGRPPKVRYPGGEIREYTPGLEFARERLDRDNSRLRDAKFDVRMFVPSLANDPDGEQFQALLASIREHGFLKQFAVLRHADDIVLDGHARIRAAETLGLPVVYYRYSSPEEKKAARLRDTPLSRILLALDANAGRLAGEVPQAVHERVARVTGRSWDETAADLELTADWRRSTAGEYSPLFQVKKLVLRPGDDAKVQVTPDDKVMLRSLVEAAGLSNYKISILRDHVPFERARSAHSPGRKAVFARADDLIAGIAAMQNERRTGKLKLDPEWSQIHDWLLRTFPPRSAGGETAGVATG